MSFALHTRQELSVPEQDAVLPEAGVVRFFGMSISESDFIDGVGTLAHVTKVLSASGFGILDSCIHVCVQVSIQVYIDQSRKEVRSGMSRDGSSLTNEQRRELAHE